MWTIVLCVVAVLVVYWIDKWRNPSCNGVLPPGSMGLPLIGETIHLIFPSFSLDYHPFIKKRRFGPIFRTNILGRPAVVLADPEINSYIIQNEGKLVEIWYMDSLSKILHLGGESNIDAFGIIHKYIRSLILNHIGSETLRERLLPHVENIVGQSLQMWSNEALVDVKKAVSIASSELIYALFASNKHARFNLIDIFMSVQMACDFTAKQLFSYDPENSSYKLSEQFPNVQNALMCLPLNIPGTTYHKCLKDKDRLQNILRSILKERMNLPAELQLGDFLDQIIADMNKEKFLTEDFIVSLIFVVMLASFESISAALSLALKLIGDNPSVEHEIILKKRENPNSQLTWAEYKSMAFTLWVINETLRLGNVAPGLLRRSLQDRQVKGYTIPAGWVVMLVNSHLNPTTFKDPLELNPWRWKEFDSYAVSKYFTPFGGGRRQCAGSEFTKLLMAIFLHKLVTKYRWKIIKQGKIGRNPVLGFGDGIHVSFTPKDN